MSRKQSVISLKGLLHRANIASTAVGFFNGYLANLESGKIPEEIDELVSPFVRKINTNELRAGQALNELKDVLFAAKMAADLKAAEASLNKIMNVEPKVPLAYVATIRNPDGQIMTMVNDKGEVKELYKEFEKQSDAERWCFRRLFHDSSPDWHGEVFFTKALPGIDDTLVISRETAIEQILRPGRTPVMHKTKTSATLSNKMRAKGDHCHFSHG